MDLFKATPINENYHYGTLGEFRVVIRTSDNWINISKLCASAGKKTKEFTQWRSLEGHKEMLQYYSKIYEHLPSLDDEDEPPQDPGVVQKEYYCLDIVGDTELKGIPKRESNIIRGTYVPNLLAIQVAQWVSFDFGHKVSSIVVDHYRYSMVKKDETINKQQTTIEELRALILKGQEEAKQQNLDLLAQNLNLQSEVQAGRLDNKVQSDRLNEKIDKLQMDVNKLYDLCANKECSNEHIIVYRELGDDKSVLRIRTGTANYLKNTTKDADIVATYKNISNSKMFLREAKKLGYIPKNGNSIIYNIPLTSDRKKLRQFLRAIDNKHVQELEMLSCKSE